MNGLGVFVSRKIGVLIATFDPRRLRMLAVKVLKFPEKTKIQGVSVSETFLLRGVYVCCSIEGNDIRETDVSIDDIVRDKQTARGGSMWLMVRHKSFASTSKARKRGQGNRGLVWLHEALGLFTSIATHP